MADEACAGSLTVALSQAVTAIAAAVDGSSSALSSFFSFWDSSVQSAAAHYEEDQHKSQNSRTVSSLSMTSSSSFSPSSTSASKTCQYPRATVSRATKTQVGATAYPLEFRTLGAISACLRIPPFKNPGGTWSPRHMAKRLSEDEEFLEAYSKGKFKKPVSENRIHKYQVEIAYIRPTIARYFIAVRGKPGPAIKEVAREDLCETDDDMINTDHVYEKVLLSKFLTFLDGEENCSQDYCQIFHEILSTTDRTGTTLMQRWANQLPAFGTTTNEEPSLTNTGLVPLDSKVNEMKGQVSQYLHCRFKFDLHDTIDIYHLSNNQGATLVLPSRFTKAFSSASSIGFSVLQFFVTTLFPERLSSLNSLCISLLTSSCLHRLSMRGWKKYTTRDSVIKTFKRNSIFSKMLLSSLTFPDLTMRSRLFLRLMSEWLTFYKDKIG